MPPEDRLPKLRPIPRPVDVSEIGRFPNINEAIDHARRMRIANDG